MHSFNFSPKAVANILEKAASPAASAEPGARSMYRSISLALPGGREVPEEGLSLTITDEAVAWLRKVGVLHPTGLPRREQGDDLGAITRRPEAAGGGLEGSVEDLIARCDAGDQDACRELDRRGIEPELLPVVEDAEDEALRRIFLSSDAYRDVQEAQALRRGIGAEVVPGGFVVGASDEELERIRALGIGIVDYPEGGLTSEQGRALEGRRS